MPESMASPVTSPCPSILFQQLFPALQSSIRFQLRHLRFQDREELSAAAIAAAYVMCVRLCQRGRSHLAYVSPLARWGVRQVLAGRSVGNRLNSRDMTSHACRQRHGVRQQVLHAKDSGTGEWRERLIDDRTATPAEIATTRLDFAAWLESLVPQKRAIAQRLATGESTSEAARHFHISPGRISQIRRELETDWLRFQSETP